MSDVLPTYVDPRSAEFQSNAEAMRALLDEFHARQAKVRQGGSARARQRHIERGKLLPRERVELLLDPGAPFLELSTLAAWGMYNDESPGASGINGIGTVSGVECMLFANDATAKGGASYPMSVRKSLRANGSLFGSTAELSLGMPFALHRRQRRREAGWAGLLLAPPCAATAIRAFSS